MVRRLRGCLLPLVIIFYLGCTESNVSPEVDNVVVEAFLFEGEPVDDIRLVEILPSASDRKAILDSLPAKTGAKVTGKAGYVAVLKVP